MVLLRVEKIFSRKRGGTTNTLEDRTEKLKEEAVSSGPSDTVYSALANLDVHDKSIPPDRREKSFAVNPLSILTDERLACESLLFVCLVILSLPDRINKNKRGVRMLLELRLENFKSFKAPSTFSMVPNGALKELDYSLLKEDAIGTIKEQKLLCSSILIGPNAAGKSNFFCAMDFLRNLILSGNIFNCSFTFPEPDLSLIPNSTLNKAKPISLGITFLTQGVLIDYDVSLELGAFLDRSAKKLISFESLKINGKPAFERQKDHVELFDNEPFNSKWRISGSQKLIKLLAQESLKTKELFLTNGFKCLVSQEIVSMIETWFGEHLCTLDLSRNLAFEAPSHSQSIESYLKAVTVAAKANGSETPGFSLGSDENSGYLFSVLENLKGKKEAYSVKYESTGTLKFMRLFPQAVEAIKNGSVLVVDQLDASINPMTIMSLINIFHNDGINKNGAQLIFATCNPIYLNPNLFRRDEVKFVNKEDDSGSTIYSLSDFGTEGEGGVKTTDDYAANYLMDCYGAMSGADFTEAFCDLVNN